MANAFKDILVQAKSRVAGSSSAIRLLVAALLAGQSLWTNTDRAKVGL